jgi:NAD+ kinase
MDRRNGEGSMGGIIKTIGIIHHTSKEASLGVARDVLEWLAKKGIEARVLGENTDELKHFETESSRYDFMQGLDLVLSLGGDGAMLHASAVAYRAEIPVMGINLGKKGFLTAMESDQMYEGLEEILEGHYKLQQRMMLECIPDEDDNAVRYFALNEVAVGKRELQRMIRLEVDINGQYFHYYSGDGVIFSTPTGSTAYSLSAGGPIVDPALDCIILTPICSHSLMDRSVIISPESEIEVMIERERVLPTLSFDGREEIELPRGGKMIIRRAERRLKIIKMANYSFYNLLRDKFDFPVGGK